MISLPGILQTLTAAAGEGQLAGFHAAAGLAASLGAEGLWHLHLGKIDHRVAVAANEVNMRLGVGVKPFDSIDCAQADDLALLLEPGKVAVDGAEA